MAGLSPPPDQAGAVESYATLSDVPNDLDAGTVVYVEDEAEHYFEDGT
jgi:hypothetical protein